LRPEVEISLITMFGTVTSSALAAAAVYIAAKVNAKAHLIVLKANAIEAKVDGQLTEVIALRDAVAFGKGEDKQRGKQDLKDAVAAGIKEANGEKPGQASGT
jgi:hypothetical protein